MPPAAGGLSPPDPRHGGRSVGWVEAWSAGGRSERRWGPEFRVARPGGSRPAGQPEIPAPNSPAKRGDFGAIKASRQNHLFSHGWRKSDRISRTGFGRRGRSSRFKTNLSRTGQPRAHRGMEIFGPSSSRRQPGASTARKFHSPRGEAATLRALAQTDAASSVRPFPKWGFQRGSAPLAAGGIFLSFCSFFCPTSSMPRRDPPDTHQAWPG
jgi:hypothetical protein